MKTILLETHVTDESLSKLDHQAETNSAGNVTAKNVIQNFAVQAIKDLELDVTYAKCTIEPTKKELTDWRRQQIKAVERLMQRAEDLTTLPGELDGHRDLEWMGQMPAHPEMYIKEEWEESNRTIHYLMEEFHGTLERLEDEYPKLATIRHELNQIEAWEDI